MDYSKLTPLLVEAIKAVRAEKDVQIQTLNDENAQLRVELESLLRRVKALENRVAHP